MFNGLFCSGVPLPPSVLVKNVKSLKSGFHWHTNWKSSGFQQPAGIRVPFTHQRLHDCLFQGESACVFSRWRRGERPLWLGRSRLLSGHHSCKLRNPPIINGDALDVPGDRVRLYLRGCCSRFLLIDLLIGVGVDSIRSSSHIPEKKKKKKEG